MSSSMLNRQALLNTVFAQRMNYMSRLAEQQQLQEDRDLARKERQAAMMGDTADRMLRTVAQKRQEELDRAKMISRMATIAGQPIPEFETEGEQLAAMEGAATGAGTAAEWQAQKDREKMKADIAADASRANKTADILAQAPKRAAETEWKKLQTQTLEAQLPWIGPRSTAEIGALNARAQAPQTQMMTTLVESIAPALGFSPDQFKNILGPLIEAYNNGGQLSAEGAQILRDAGIEVPGTPGFVGTGAPPPPTPQPGLPPQTIGGMTPQQHYEAFRARITNLAQPTDVAPLKESQNNRDIDEVGSRILTSFMTLQNEAYKNNPRVKAEYQKGLRVDLQRFLKLFPSQIKAEQTFEEIYGVKLRAIMQEAGVPMPPEAPAAPGMPSAPAQ